MNVNLPQADAEPTPGATTAPLVATVTPTPAPVVDKIAFSSSRSADDRPDIYLMNSDGSGLARLTDDPEGAAAPAWSPDGSQIAFITGRGDQARLAILTLEDSTVTLPETSLTGPTQTSWSPDGLKLAVVAVDPAMGGGQDIFLVDLQSPQQPVNLTHHPGDDTVPAWSADGKRLAFQSDRDGNDEVYVMYANGSAQTPLTNHPGFDGQPTWAGDSQRLAFVSDRGGQFAIYLMADGGEEPTALTTSTLEAASPAWQPPPPAPFVDTLVYAAANDGLSDLYTVGINGASQQNLTRDPGLDNTMPAWSPDGSRIAFASTETGDYDIFVLSIPGAPGQADTAGSAELASEPVNLTNDPAKDMRPAWSPDGSQLAFESDRSGQWQVWIMNSDGSNLRQLTTGPFDSGNPAWSSDGSQVAFASNRTGNFDIFVANADGSGQPLNLTHNPANEFNPAWSPQDEQLAFRSDQNDNHQIYVVKADGSGLRRLLFTQADDDQPAWSPDGSQIAFISNRALGSEGRRSRQPSPSYALYVFDLETRATKLVAGEGGLEIRYPSWKPRP